MGFSRVPPSGSLRDVASNRGLLYGAAASKSHLSSDQEFAAVFAEQCAILVPEIELKWDKLRPSPDTFDFASADWLYAFTQQHHLQFRGHVLVWQKSLPKWFDAYANSANAKQLLLTHISKVVGRYRNKIQSWDVINEVISPDDRRNDGLSNSPWMRLIGPEYIEMAFHAAAEADPSALLTWNENLLEEDSRSGEVRRAFMLQKLKELLKQNVPVQAVGIQSHLSGDHADIAGPHFQRFLQEVGDLGLKIVITELDVRDDNLPADVATRDRLVADMYYRYLSTVLRQPAVIAVLTWGISDRYTWLQAFHPRKDGTQVRPLPLDAALHPVPAFDSIMRAFEEASER
jgi:endo-1,4-beta-xylanase